jgi:hypothetical protein
MATARARRSPRAGAKTPRQARSRKDPAPRHLDGTRPWGIVVNQDPDYDYHFWGVLDTGHGLAEARAQGWEPVQEAPASDEHSERLLGGTVAKPGEHIVSRGLILTKRHKKLGQFAQERKKAFSDRLNADLGIPKHGSPQQRWNRGGIVGNEPNDLPMGIEETVKHKHEGAPYGAPTEEIG